MSISAPTSISAADRAAILAHLPDPVKEAVEATNHDVIGNGMDFISKKYLEQRVVVVHPSPYDTGGSIVIVNAFDGQHNGCYEFPFKDKKCTGAVYQRFTKDKGKLDDDIVGRIYLFCLKRQIAIQDQPRKWIAMPEAICRLIQEGVITKEQIDMEALRGVYLQAKLSELLFKNLDGN